MNEWEWNLLEDKAPVAWVETHGVQVKIGDRVRLCPRGGGDIFDLALTGKTAVIESLEQDYEGKMHVCVVLDEDPGRDIGLMGQPGHRFFFAPEEVEPVPPDQNVAAVPRSAGRKILVAGVGNIFQADDGFGVAVAGRLAAEVLPSGVRVKDFGIRGLDLVYALLEGYDTTILVDAYPGDGPPGTLFVVEPDIHEMRAADAPPDFIEPHALDPLKVLRMAVNMGGELNRVLLVGCVPATLGPEEGQMGLSEPVAAAVDDAVRLIDSLVTRILAGEWPGNQ